MEAYENTNPARLWAEGLGGELRSMRRLPMPQTERRFCIFAQGRSGSTLLTTLLDSHPEIRCEGELLRRPRLLPLRYVERQSRGPEPVFGFHLKPYHLTRFQRVTDIGAFLRRLADDGWRFVHLTRRDVVAHAFSNVHAKRHGWHRRDDTGHVDVPRIAIDPERFVKRVQDRLDWHEREVEALAGLPSFPISYEDDLSDAARREPRLRALLAELGVPWRQLSSPLRKSVRRPVWELMANPDEVRSALQRAGINAG
jgi:LPS sulfotransferase NodH